MYKTDAKGYVIKDEQGKPVIEVEGDPKDFLKNNWRHPSLDNAKVRLCALRRNLDKTASSARVNHLSRYPGHPEMEGTDALERRQEQDERDDY